MENESLEVQLNYGRLNKVFKDAFRQASAGKGKERHADDNAFEDQLICQIARQVGTGFTKGQAIKKIVESTKIRHLKGIDAEIHELHGALNYIAGTIIVLEDAAEKVKEVNNARSD